VLSETKIGTNTMITAHPSISSWYVKARLEHDHAIGSIKKLLAYIQELMSALNFGQHAAHPDWVLQDFPQPPPSKSLERS
jgi:hypothetical protein